MMDKMIKPFLGIAILGILSSCSTNQELAQLEEYDDLYYTPSNDRNNDEIAYESDQFIGANSAESSYYGESPYVDEAERPSAEYVEEAPEEEELEEDYYDPDYARRIENFHRDEDPHYVYSDAYANNMNPQFHGNMSFNSFNGFNSMGVGFGMTFGNPWMGNRYCDPFFDPWCNRGMWGAPGMGMSVNMGWGSTWGMYDPFMNPWMNPWASTWGSPWMNPWNNPYAWNNPWMNPWGPSVIVVDGSNTRSFQNTTRSSNGSNRMSRGGVAGVPSQSRSGAKSSDGAKNATRTSTRGDVSRTRPARTESSADYYDRSYSERTNSSTTRNSTTRSSNSVRSSNQRSSQSYSPYTRERQRQQNTTSRTPDYSRYNRSNTRTNTSYSSPRSTRSNNSYSTPRSRSNSTFSSPSRSRSTFSTPSSSPSRSTGGSRRR